MRRHVVVGCFLTIFLVVGLGGWATVTELSGAVIAPGTVVVDSNVKKVQHPTGGVVGELRVRDGAIVRAGDVVVRLDETQARANLDIVVQALDELAARRARDEAERDGAIAVAFPPALTAQSGDPRVASLIAGEQHLFEIRRWAREGQKAQLKERAAQLKEEIHGLAGQTSAKTREIELIGVELKGVRELWQKNLVQLPRVTALERDAARLEGERGALIAGVAQAKGKIAEIELQILQIDQDLRTEVGKDLAEIRAKASELTEKKVSAEDQLKRIDIRAPQDGTVHELAVHTVGGVVGAGEALMLIVPRVDALAVEARIPPQDIDQLRAGQRAVLRFTAFNQRTTPEVNGEVSLVSPDVTEDAKTGASFYTVRITLPEGELARLLDRKLVPGMPVESFIQTGERTVLSYLTKPLADQIAKAWREK
jgi:HlyD family secretion protein